MKNTEMNIRQQVNAIREQEIARVAQGMEMIQGDATTLTARFPIYRRTMNDATEARQIEAFENGNETLNNNERF